MTLLDEMAAARLPWTSPRLRAWSSPEELQARLREGMSQQADWVGNEAWGAQFRDNVGTVDVPDALDWANRRIELAGGGWAVTGTRYRGMDLAKPFVDVVATTVAPEPAALLALAAEVLPQYVPFGARTVRVDAPDPEALAEAALASGAFESASVDRYIVAGLAADLRARERVVGYERVTLEPVTAPEAAPEVARMYAEIGAERPDLPLWATPADAEDLADCEGEGLLFRVLVDGKPAGVVAAHRDDQHGLAGHQMEEMVLDRDFLGQRLAPAVLQRFVDELPGGPGEVLWGAIDPGNLPSLRNARAVGREVVGGYVWLVPRG